MTGKCQRDLMLKVIGYAPRNSDLDALDYKDFPVGRRLSITEMEAGLELGVFPPGLLVMAPGGKPGMVVGFYGYDEWVEVVE